MQFTYIDEGVNAVVIDNFYNQKQLDEIHLELKWLTKASIFVDQNNLVTAEQNGVPIAKKTGIFLESVFLNWNHSALISHCMQNMTSEEFKNNILRFNTMYKSLLSCNVRSHLLSYYENSDYYKPHVDSFFFTVLNYFNTEPKQFSGGEIVLYSCNSNKQVTIEPINNRTVIIPSCTLHEVNSIVSSLDNTLSGNGRYCNSVFLSVVDKRELDKRERS